MKKNAIVLGCGLVGATMVRDLAADEDFEVAAADIEAGNIEKLTDVARAVQADLGDAAQVGELVSDFDVVLGALPSHLGFQTLRAVIEAGKPYCDISFMPEDALELDWVAKSQGVSCVVDCGVSPGLSNMIVGRSIDLFDRIDRAVICVGGLPKERRWPFQYKAPFAPYDVLELYTRPARVVEGGRVVTRPALSDVELIDVPGVGTLEAFTTDGLRSLLETVSIPHLVEKTLRYPGHAELMRVFRECGFFSRDEVEVNGVDVRPLEVTARLLFPLWAFEPGEEEFTVLRVEIEGEQGGKPQRLVYELYDEYDRATGTTSMARTTAFPCTIVARMLARGEIQGPGVLPSERVAQQPGIFDRIVGELKSRGVNLVASEM